MNRETFIDLLNQATEDEYTDITQLLKIAPTAIEFMKEKKKYFIGNFYEGMS